MNKHKLQFWNNHYIPLNNNDGTLLTNNLIKLNVNKFWKDFIIPNLNDNQHILFLFRIQWVNNEVATIGNLQKLTLSDKDFIINYIISILELKAEEYTTVPIIGIIFSFGIREGKISSNILSDKVESKINFQTYYHYKLPISFDPLKYGKLLSKIENIYHVYINERNLAQIIVDPKSKINKVKIFRKGDLLLQYKDTYVNESTFFRIIGKNKYTFINNEVVLVQIGKKVKFIKKITKSKKIKNNILTMDIETFISENKHIPYSICIFDGIRNISFKYYLTDFNSPIDMLKKAILDISIRKYKGYNIYLHNFSKFDGIFLFKLLAEIGDIQPIDHKGRLISVDFIFNNYIFYFRDSYLLLPSSLKKLSESFNVINKKGFLDHNKINITNLFKFKNEVIEYCLNDCISLYQILNKFNNLIFNEFNLNINNYPTLPSLSFAIFRCNYMIEDTIAELSGKIYNDLSLSYTGGSVDMFLPEGHNIYCYDVNSLYPFIMKEYPMPIGKPTYFEGNIRLIKPNAFGIFYCKITTPSNLQHPIIQTHVKINNGIRTMSPLGIWYDWINSLEIDNALKFGYKFDIIKGYSFDKGYPFKDFIDNLYKIRLDYPKSDPMNYVAKILMNSLYGRFGMNDNFNSIYILEESELKQIENNKKFSIVDIISLGKKFMVKFEKSNIENLNTILDNASETHNINIAISSTITAGARVHMSQFKNNNKFNLFYTDTDSIYINKPLGNDLVNNNELGKLKLEYIAKRAIFLSPKFYCLLTDDNKFIYKVKGLNHDIELNINDFEYLLTKNNFINKSQIKWFKSLTEGNISLLDQIYTMKVTENKRKLIYKNDKLVNTTPFRINEEKII